ncbi:MULTISPECIES: hypothetical protein [unclassified Streptomyces]|uniref:hypothetical protein n=1 Tax=unclassified Streptomyces TaxID=2593676 RepID=UPI00278C89DF|nr:MULTISPECIES: hypothetical protein [unclassified Streptomyces]
MAATHRTVPKRLAAGITAAAACAAALAGCAAGESAHSPERTEPRKGAPGPKKAKAAAPGSAVRLIGDGSTAYTGRQPNVPRAERLRPGQKPPQFVVFSWDGAGEDSQKLFSHFRKVAKENNATMTYFLSGVYLLPRDKAGKYHAPQHSAGRSDIGFNDSKGIKDTVEQLRGAWLEGNEIGTHFNGHFCGKNGGVGQWSVDEWKSEIRQAKSFVKAWKSNAGLNRSAPLPFDYDKELIGARTPCLEGKENFRRAASDLGFRYDTSGVNEQVWPKKKNGLWDLSMQLVPFKGHSYEQLTMDYNFMANQSGSATQGDPAKHAYWGDQMRDSLLAGFDRAYKGNRAPLVIGNHFESWNGGTYMRAVEQTVERVCKKPDVRCVSFKQVTDWLDAQDPKTLKKLGRLAVSEEPKEGWAAFLERKGVKIPKGAPGAPATKS